jgi:hypothetical protein
MHIRHGWRASWNAIQIALNGATMMRGAHDLKRFRP